MKESEMTASIQALNRQSLLELDKGIKAILTEQFEN